MDPAFAIQSIFVVPAASIILVNSIPSLRARFIAYGARESSKTAGPSTVGISHTSNGDSSWLQNHNPLDVVANIRVPHSWFLHFYVVSIVLSGFWALQIAVQGNLFRIIASSQARSGNASMRPGQVALAWALMTFQGARRLYEARVYMKLSQSKMWIGHWAIGIVFYTAMSVAVWIEGSSSLLRTERLLPTGLVEVPNLRTFIGLLLFLSSSVVQHDCHGYLSSLPKYSIPKSRAFRWVLCPHYTTEGFIYLSIAIIAAPPGKAINRSIFAAFAFTVVNLGVTARSTRAWYFQKFGKNNVGDVKALIPHVY